MRRYLVWSPILALTLAACVPTQAASKGFNVGEVTFQAGQTWEVKAWGGQNWKDGIELHLNEGSDQRASKFKSLSDKNLGTIQYFFPESMGEGAALWVNWNSTFSELNGVGVSCVILDLNPQSLDPVTFKGRWAANFNRAVSYSRTRDTTGTGECILQLKRANNF